MKQTPILITAVVLALSAWPLCAQENVPQPPQPNPPQREAGPRPPDADRPEAPRDREARPQNRDGGFGEGGFHRDGGQTHRPDRQPDQRREDRPDRQNGPPFQQARPDGDSQREGFPPPQMHDERREGPRAGQRGGEQGPRFGPQGGGPGMNMRPPQMEQRGGPNDFQMPQRPDGMRRHHRRMMDNYGFAPQRGDGQDFRRGGDEMRAPTPPPPRDRQFGPVGPGNGQGPGWNPRQQFDGPREMMRPRPEFGPQNRGGQGPGFGPRGDFNGPRPPMGSPFGNDGGPRPPRPHRDGLPQPGWEENRQPNFN